MSKALADAHKKQKKADRANGREKGEKPLSAEERKALGKLRREAKQAGAKLKNGGKGGLSPSLVLKVFRRDGFTCKKHGDKGQGDFGGLELHHKGGIVESEWLSKKGHKNEPNNLVVICAKGHDEVHEKARSEGNDSSQKKPKGDSEGD